METIKRILVVNYLTQNTRDALHYGVYLAKRFGAELYVLRVVSNPVDLEAVNAPSLFFQGEQYKNYLNIREQYQQDLEKAIRAEAKGGFPIKEMVTDKLPLPEIVRIVREDQIDLVVILAHEEGRLEHLLFGRETDALLRKLPCSVMLLKHEPKPVEWESTP